MSAEYKNERFAFAGHVIDRLDQWVAWCHSGKGVVPVDWRREVDRNEPRIEPDPLIGAAVDAIYRRWLAHNRSQALVIAAMCFGARKGLIASMRRDPDLVRHSTEWVSADYGSVRAVPMAQDFRRRDADDLLRVFAREVGDINISKAMADAAAKINRPVPMATIEEYRKPLPRPKVNSPEWVAQHFEGGAK